MTSVATSDISTAKYTTGTLRYTKFGLFTLFSWLLWGDFCFTLMEGVGNIYPTFLIMKLHFSNTAATVITSVIPQILGIFVGPAVSFKSDRTHSRFGRRIPYMAFTAPFLCLFLIGMGFSGEIASYLTTSSLPAKLGISPAMAVLIVIGFLTTGFAFFNEFVDSVYWYLFNDVVPLAFMGRFLSLFRIVGTGAGMFYKAFIFQYSLDYMQWVFLGITVLYFIGICLMCWRVREGKYPPVTDVTAKTGILTQILLYFRECFRHPIYVFMFLCTALTGLGLATSAIVLNIFGLGIGITMSDIGYITAFLAMAQIISYYPCGYLVDKLHSIRVSLAVILMLSFSMFWGYFFAHGYWSYAIFLGIFTVAWGAYRLASNPLYMCLFPREKYGQFCSANGMVRAAAVVLGGLATGPYLDWVTDNGKNMDNYRYSFLMIGFLFAASLACLVVVYIYWKRRGGQKGYHPPAT